MLKKIYEIYNNLEINKSTRDVKDDLKYANFKGKLLHKAFYTVALGLGLIIFSTTWNKIADSSFRQALINEGSTPFFTLFASDYSSEKVDLKEILKEYYKKNRELAEKIAELKKQLGYSNFNRYSAQQETAFDSPFGKLYPFEKFIKEYKNDEIKEMDIKKTITENLKYKIFFFQNVSDWVAHHTSDTIELGTKSFTIEVIANKLRGIEDKNARFKGAEKPLKKIIPLIGIEDTETNRKITLEALLRPVLYNYRGENNTISQISLLWKNLDKTNKGYEILKEVYIKNFKVFSKKATAKYHVVKEELEKLHKQKKTLEANINLGREAERKIEVLQADVKNYDSNKVKVNEALEAFEKGIK